MRSLVIGLGNSILTDDAVGILAARLLAQALPAGAPVDVAELSVGGLALMEAMIGYRQVLILDAIRLPHRQPGTLFTFDAGSFPPTLNSASSHDVDLPTALKIGRRLGAALPTDENLQIVAVQAQDVLTFGSRPGPAVEAAIPAAAAAALTLLGYPGEALIAALA